MEEIMFLLIPALIFIILFLIIWLKYKIKDWNDSRKFWKKIDVMVKRYNKKYVEILMETLEAVHLVVTERIKDPENVQERFCPECKKTTVQIVKLYNPDNPEDGEVWQCMFCKEHTGWTE